MSSRLMYLGEVDSNASVVTTPGFLIDNLDNF
jgi:hypothetical protein